MILAFVDVSTAFLQADMFGPDDPPRYLKVFDPVTSKWRYFRQLGNLYGSSSAGKRWEKTLVSWLVSDEVGFEQGSNEPCAFFQKAREIRQRTSQTSPLIFDPFTIS